MSKELSPRLKSFGVNAIEGSLLANAGGLDSDLRRQTVRIALIRASSFPIDNRGIQSFISHLGSLGRFVLHIKKVKFSMRAMARIHKGI